MLPPAASCGPTINDEFVDIARAVGVDPLELMRRVVEGK
jgi:hypothetical protein